MTTFFNYDEMTWDAVADLPRAICARGRAAAACWRHGVRGGGAYHRKRVAPGDDSWQSVMLTSPYEAHDNLPRT